MCNEGFELLSSPNNQPNCIKYESVEKLISLGWERVVQQLEIPKYDTTTQYDPLKEYYKVFPKQTGTSIEISRDVIAGNNYITFEGNGWQRLHNVEITISNELEIIDSVRSKTTDHGRLNMPWPIPEDFVSGIYHIKADDGFNQIEFDITISS